MASTFDATVLDFDLNFLSQPAKSVVSLDSSNKLDKQRRAIIRAKKTTIATDLLIRRYYEKKEILEVTEKNLLQLQEECKKVCLDYKCLMDRYENLEQENKRLQNASEEQMENFNMLQNQFGALHSHANQLQELVKERDTKIESMKIDSQLETSHSLTTQKQKVASLQKENEMLMRHINLFIEAALGKKKLEDIPRFTLKRYEKLNSGLSSLLAESGNVVFVDNTSNSRSATDVPTYSLIDSLDNKEISNEPSETNSNEEKEKLIKKLDTDHDLDEAFSVDTGRGSSLEFSDTEKCFQSPDHFMNDDSPLSVYKNKPGLVSTATSPINVPKKVNTAVSPILFENDAMPVLCQENKTTSIGSMFSPIRNEPIQLCVPASPTIDPEICTTPENPVYFESNDSEGDDENASISKSVVIEIIKSPIQPSVESLNNVDETVPSPESFMAQESPIVEIETNTDSQVQECLGQDISSSFCEDSSSDYEVENILKSMRWKRKLITPIPTTPVKIRHLDEETVVKKKIEITSSEQFVCNESVKIREDNKVIHASLAYLAKEIMNIKSLLKNKLADEKATESLNDIDFDFNREMVLNVLSEKEQNCCIENEQDLSTPPIPPSPAPTEIIGYSEDVIDTNAISVDSCPPLEEPIKKTIILEENIPETISARVEIIETPITLNDRLLFEERTQNEGDSDDLDDFDDEGPDLITIVEDSSTTCEEIEKCKKRKEKMKRLTKLEKMRKRLAPKRKITSELSSIRQIKKNILTNKKIMANASQPKKTITESDSSATLNDKAVYEKALKVMAELKSKQEVKDKSIRNKTKPASNSNNDNEISKKDDILISAVEPCLPNNSNTNGTCGKYLNIIQTDTDSQRNEDAKDDSMNCRILRRRTLKRGLEPKYSEEQPKRVLRSSVRHSISEKSPQRNMNSLKIVTSPEKNRKLITYDELFGTDTVELCADTNHINKDITVIDDKTTNDKTQSAAECTNTSNNEIAASKHNEIIDSESPVRKKYKTDQAEETPMNPKHIHPKDSILCRMIDQHAAKYGKRSRKTTEALSTMICNKITDGIAKIIELPEDKSRLALDKLIVDLRSWKLKNFLSGLMKYMKNPERKVELFNLVNSPPAPPMTKSEKILLCIIMQLNKSNDWGSDVINSVLESIEFTLFQLNHTPEFDVIESMAHFYAILCRRIKAKSRLRLFVMDAMYCIQYKAIPLIKQCMQVWMHILPLSNMKLAKNPLVTCLVYLLHFYKCDDKFKRVSEIRRLLQSKYYFNISEWNDSKIMEMLKNAIREMRDIPVERKMLRMALIIVAKRLGARWCQENIIKKLLLPLIEREAKTEKTREFCVSVLGPLLKPYPAEMKVHCEIVVNQLLDMLDQNPSPTMEEAIFTSLIFINKHNPNRILKALTMWKAQNVSPELEDLLKDFVRNKPVKGWKAVLSKLPLD